MLVKMFAAAVLLLLAQEAPDSDLRGLSDDRLEVRGAAAVRLVERFPVEGAALRRWADEAKEPEVRARLRDIIAAGELLVDRRGFSKLLSPETRASYPELEADLFSTDLERRTQALRVLARSGSSPGPRGEPHALFFMTQAECRQAVPLLAGLIRGGDDLEPVKSAWIDLASLRPSVLASPRALTVSREMFRDPSPQIRSQALQKLQKTPAFDQEAPRILADLDSVEKPMRIFLAQGIIERRIEAGYPYVARLLGEPELAGTLAGQIIDKEVQALYPEILRAYEMGEAVTYHLLENLPRADVLAAVLRKLDGSSTDKVAAFAALDHLKIDGLSDRAASELVCPDGKVREAAVNYLQRHGSTASKHAKAVANCIVECWDGTCDLEFGIYAATGLLGTWKAVQEIEALIPRIKDKSSFYQSVSMIQAAKPPHVAKQLIQLVDGKDPEFSAAVLKMIGELDAKEEFLSRREIVQRLLIPPGHRSWGDYGHSLFTSAAKFGMREIITMLLEWDRDANRQGWTATGLGYLWTVEEKLEALRSEEAARRHLGAWSISYQGPKEAHERLRKMSTHEDPEVRRALAYSLGQQKDAEGWALLVRLTRDENPQVSEQAAWALLERSHTDKIVPWGEEGHGYTLDFEVGKDFLGSKSQSLRLAAVRGMTPQWARGNPAALETLMADPDLAVQRTVWRFVEQNPDLMEPALLLRRAMASMTDACELRWTLNRLGARLPPEEIAPLVHQFLEDLIAEKKEIKPRTFQHSHGDVVYDRNTVIQEACSLLGTFGYRKAEPTFLALLHSPDPKRRDAVLDGIGGVAGEKAVPKLTELLTVQYPFAPVKALGRIGIFGPDFLDPKKEALACRLQAVQQARSRSCFDAAAALIGHQDWAVTIAAVDTVGAMAQSNDAVRILRLAYTPYAQNRAKLLATLARLRAPELAAEVAVFLDDEPIVAVAAAQFLVAQGVKVPFNIQQIPPPALVVLLPLMDKNEAKAALSRLQEESRRPWRENRAMEALGILKALVRHSNPDLLSELLAAIRRMPEGRRQDVFLDLVDGYGKAAIGFLREEIRQGSDYMRLAAARALAAAGDTESRLEIEQWLLEKPHGYGRGADMAALLRGGFTETAERLLEKHLDEQSLAIAALGGMEQAKRKVLDLLRAMGPVPWSLLDQLHASEDPNRWESKLLWSPLDGVQRLEEGVATQRSGEQFRLSAAPGVRGKLDVRALNALWSEYFVLSNLIPPLGGQPFRRWAWYWESPGVLRVDDPIRVRDYWIDRFAK
jgi:HEAT repeat protein